MTPQLIVMVKEPRPGRVKTRLGREIGMVPAAWWYRHQTADLLRRVADPRWQIVLAVSPDRAVTVSRLWPHACARRPQGRGDLGRRMVRQLRYAQSVPVCLIGSDVPGITSAHIAEAFAILGSADLVFGPAIDGGYWLIGRKPGCVLPRCVLDGVRWSGPHALGDTLACFPDRRVGFARELHDVDEAADLRMTPPGARAT